MSSTSTTIEKTVFFAAPRETVWSFLTEKDKLAQWFNAIETDLALGEEYTFMKTNDEGVKVKQIWGKVLTMEAPSVLVYTFIVDPFNGAETLVTWTLEEVTNGTRLSLRHEGVAEACGDAAMRLLIALDRGWDTHFSSLRDAVGS